MTHTLLKNNSSTSGWQAENILQFVDANIHICLKKGEEQILRKIQKSARSIKKIGVKHVRLIGKLWDEKAQWSFALGFTCVGKLNNIEFTGDDKIVNILNSKLMVYAWSRDHTNQTLSQL